MITNTTELIQKMKQGWILFVSHPLSMSKPDKTYIGKFNGERLIESDIVKSNVLQKALKDGLVKLYKKKYVQGSGVQDKTFYMRVPESQQIERVNDKDRTLRDAGLVHGRISEEDSRMGSRINIGGRQDEYDIGDILKINAWGNETYYIQVTDKDRDWKDGRAGGDGLGVFLNGKSGNWYLYPSHNHWFYDAQIVSIIPKPRKVYRNKIDAETDTAAKPTGPSGLDYSPTTFQIHEVQHLGKPIYRYAADTASTLEEAQQKVEKFNARGNARYGIFKFSKGDLIPVRPAVEVEAKPQVTNNSVKPKPGRFQQENRLGWTKGQYNAFLNFASPQTAFRKDVKDLASGNFQYLTSFLGLIHHYIEDFTTRSPYPGIVRQLNIIQDAVKNTGSKPAYGTIKKAAGEIEKRLQRLYDFARLQKLKSVYAKALKSARGS